jgi:histidinol-phosphate aminotransferase
VTPVIGRPRPAIAALPAYRPGKGAAQAEAEHGIVNAIKLASNETPWPPVPAVVRALEAASATTNRYADHRATELRLAIAEWVGADAAQVTVGCGSVGLLQQLLLTYVDPGDEVVYPWRSFEVYPVYTQLVGGIEVTTPLVDHTFDLEAVAAAVTPRTKLVILANPNNPTGTALPMAAIGRLLDAIGSDVIVVLDEAYREFMSSDLGDPVTDLLPRHDNLCVLRTFSKAQGLAALRVGYAIGHPELVESLDKTLFPFAVNGLGQAGALAAIRAHAEVMERVESIKAERKRVVAALADAGWRLPRPEANFVYLDLGSRTDEVYLDLERKGVVTRPFAGEGIRVTIGTAEENDRFLRALLDS